MRITHAFLLALAVSACGGPAAEPVTTPTGGDTEPVTTTTVSAPAAFAFTAAENNGTVNVSVGTQLALTLDENPTTGFSWELELSSGLSVVSDSYQTTPGREGMPGAGGTHTWTIEATTAGTQTIAGYYSRPWENPPVDAETFMLTVEVR
jgi:inhibitor of cysteine peptidase